jgi:hypothetical protein
MSQWKTRSEKIQNSSSHLNQRFSTPFRALFSCETGIIFKPELLPRLDLVLDCLVKPKTGFLMWYSLRDVVSSWSCLKFVVVLFGIGKGEVKTGVGTLIKIKIVFQCGVQCLIWVKKLGVPHACTSGA